MKFFILILLTISLQADSLVEQIKHHEGFRSKPYIDQNHYSIGYGINLRYGVDEIWDKWELYDETKHMFLK